VAKDIIILPKSVTPSRIAANKIGALDALSKLDKEDIEKLDGLAAAGKQRRFAFCLSTDKISTQIWLDLLPLHGVSLISAVVVSLIISVAVDLGFHNWPALA
jgi:hypothetical protein